jgi:hypothetical protein
MAAVKRQYIIAGIALIAMLYGLYDVLILPRPQKGKTGAGEKSPVELQTFIAQAASDIRSLKTDFGTYVVSCAERPCARNPFFAQARASRSEFSYTGYLEAGGRGLAIINQVEYQVGEELENRAGYFVKEITPSRVIIENRAAKIETAVPLHD